jgi:WD40 repeat protein
MLLQGRYVLGAILGSGGFSSVYHAWDRQAGGQEVAIKQINLQGLSAEESIEATNTFNREVTVLSTLDHPQVPRIYHHFHDQNHWYLVLEYIKGQTLENVLAMRAVQSRLLPLEEILAIVRQICTVLEYLHSRQPPIVFRDLKPSNIIRTPTGKLCLIDFGIARHFRPGQARDTQPLGSPGYAAPEQYGRGQTTPQTDIYSLGALCHFLLSGKDPAEADNPLALPVLRLNGQPGGAQLEALVQCMLAPDPHERPTGVRNVIEVLEQVEQEASTDEVRRIWLPPTPQEYPGSDRLPINFRRPQRPGFLSRRTMLITLGACAVTAAGGGAIFWSHVQNKPGVFGRSLPARSVSSGAYSYSGHTAAVRGIAWAPDNQRLASASVDATVHIWNPMARDNSPLIYRGHTGPVNTVAWTPDGTGVASGSNDGTVQIWSPTGSMTLMQRLNNMVTEHTVAWAPDNQHLAIAGWDVLIWNQQQPQKGEIDYYVTNTQGANQGVTYSVAWAPDSQRFVSGYNDQTVRAWDIVTSNNLIIWNVPGKVYAVAWSPNGKFIAFAGDDHTVHIRALSSQVDLLSYRGHTNTVYALAWSPDSQSIASASADKTVQIWAATSGQPLFTYSGHSAAVYSVAWSPNGQYLASASEDKTVQIWPAP